VTLEWRTTSIFARIARNVAWLIGSRGFTAVTSIGYLAFAARSLGPKGFGAFTLVLTYAQLIAHVVQFQSLKTVIRYGAIHLVERMPGRLARLIGLTVSLDFASGLLGALIAVAVVPLVTPVLHWDPAQQRYAQAFATALLLTTGATASGVLRLFDRFDLLAYTDAVSPAIRFLGALAAWMTGAGLGTFLVIWASAAAAQTIAQWLGALRLQTTRPRFGSRALIRAIRENPRILKFMVQTNVSNSLNSSMQLGILAVGAVAGPVEAGGFRIAQRLANGVTNPVETVTRALFPEFARLVAQDDHAKLRHVLIRVCSIAGALAALVVVVGGPAAPAILRVVAGENFAFASEFLVLLLIAAAIDLAGFALEPFHNAHGRAGRVLRIRAVSAVAYLAFLALLLPLFGAKGAAVAAVGASLITLGQFAFSSLQILRTTPDDGTSP
jgi:O-antigen/teichoic acid export membrane protein